MSSAGRVREAAEKYLRGNTAAWRSSEKISEDKLSEEDLPTLKKVAEDLSKRKQRRR